MKLTPGELLVVDLFRRFDLMTVTLILWHLADPTTLDAIKKTVYRLRARNVLESVVSPAGQAVFRLTARARRALGLPKRTRKGVTQQTLILGFAYGFGCVRARLNKLSADEFIRDYPDLVGPGLGTHSYALGEADRLYWILISQSGSPETLARKAAQQVRKRVRDHHAFRSLIDAGGFGLALFVPTEACAANTIAALLKHRIAPNVRVDVVPVSEMVPLLFARGVQ